MKKIKKVLLFSIPMSICNFRCHYCYLAQRPEHYQGVQPKMKYTPQEVAYALSYERLGGVCFMNFCADGETLLTKDIDLYVKALLEEGHYAEVVTNLTVSNALDKFLCWDKELLKRLEFKCSFHYLELKKKGWLERFADNVHKIWDAGASANIELAPSDELVPYIDEIKKFSLKYFGALPHLTILRNDRTSGIEYLTKMSEEEYDKTWSSFGSSFWEFKKTLFGRKQKGFCYAGAWSAYIDLSTGEASGCYGKLSLGNVFANPEKPFPTKPIGKCPIAHCYNGHAMLSLGLIPNHNDTRYGSLRDRVKEDGTHWLQPELRSFFNTKLEESNTEYTEYEKKVIILNHKLSFMTSLPGRFFNKLARIIKRDNYAQ